MGAERRRVTRDRTATARILPHRASVPGSRRGVASITVSRCTPSPSASRCASGSTIRPPGFRYLSSAVGTCVAAAVTTIASTDEVFAEIGRAVAVLQAHVLHLERLQVAPRLGHQRADALDRVHFARDLRQHRRLVAAAGADLEHAFRARRRCARARSSARRPTAARSSARARSAAGCRRRRGSRAPRRRRCAAARRSSPPARPRRECPARAAARSSACACAPRSSRCRTSCRRASPSTRFRRCAGCVGRGDRQVANHAATVGIWS